MWVFFLTYIGLLVSKDNIDSAPGELVVGGTALAVTAYQFWNDSPFHIFGRCRPMAEQVLVMYVILPLMPEAHR